MWHTVKCIRMYGYCLITKTRQRFLNKRKLLKNILKNIDAKSSTKYRAVKFNNTCQACTVAN